MKGSRTPLQENTMGLGSEWSFRIMAVIQKSTSLCLMTLGDMTVKSAETKLYRS